MQAGEHDKGFRSATGNNTPQRATAEQQTRRWLMRGARDGHNGGSDRYGTHPQQTRKGGVAARAAAIPQVTCHLSMPPPCPPPLVSPRTKSVPTSKKASRPRATAAPQATGRGVNPTGKVRRPGSPHERAATASPPTLQSGREPPPPNPHRTRHTGTSHAGRHETERCGSHGRRHLPYHAAKGREVAAGTAPAHHQRNRGEGAGRTND